MRKYSFKEQRDTFYEALRCDGVVKVIFKQYKWFDQLGAVGKISLPVWNNIIFRLLFNIGLPFLILFSDFYLLFKYVIQVLSPNAKESFDRLFVCKDRHLYLIANRIGLLSNEDVWFASPFDTFKLPYETKQVTVSDYATIKDVFRCFIQSIIIHFYTIYHFGYSYYLLSLKAFDWCMMDMALRKIPKNVDLYFCNICDRVSVLIDKLPNRGKIMVQHGTMHFYNNENSNPHMTWQEDKGFWIWNSLYKNSPSKVYCFTKDDEIALRRSVIANDPEFVYMGYDFHPDFKPEKFSVLIIGMYTIFKDKEKQLISNLQGLDINLYLKNHPSIANDKYDELKDKYSFIFLKGTGAKLPEVDLVISYDSTLAYEYASIGAKVLYYGHFNIDEIRLIVQKEMESVKRDN